MSQMKVYIIEAVGTEFVKIGRTGGSIKKRLRQLQTGCPHKLRVLHIFFDAREVDELALHLLLRHQKVRGEWFKLSEADLAKALRYMETLDE